jgi:seryl-tRNA synthetase
MMGPCCSLLFFNLFSIISVPKGFTPMIAPSLVRRETLMGTGYLPQSEEDIYKTQDDLYLAGTAEVSTMGYYMNEIIEASQLPLKFISYSPCFRREDWKSRQRYQRPYSSS